MKSKVLPTKKQPATVLDVIAVDMGTAAGLVGLKKYEFFRVFVKSGLIQPIPATSLTMIFRYGELREAFEKFSRQVAARLEAKAAARIEEAKAA